MEYDKPHLTLEQQVDLLRQRGLAVHDVHSATATLRRVGYYRLSAYAYPFREILSAKMPGASSVQYRADSFITDISFDLVAALWSFDRQLRLLLLDALETIEIGLRVQMSYVLGARNRFGHLDPEHLDPQACEETDPDGSPVWAAWLKRYEKSQSSAKSEDFVKHYVEKYDGRLPIWVATEIMEFGSLVRLYGLMQKSDQSAVARELGFPSGAVMYKWLKTANYLRNVCAHHARLWNRNLTYTVPKPPAGVVGGLEHLRALPASHRKKLYGSVAVITHIVTIINAETDWQRRFVALIDRFPQHTSVSPERDMGFPIDWRDESIWRAQSPS